MKAENDLSQLGPFRQFVNSSYSIEFVNFSKIYHKHGPRNQQTDAIRNLQAQLANQSQQIERQKVKNAEIVKKMSWYDHLNAIPDPKDKTIITHVSDYFLSDFKH